MELFELFVNQSLFFTLKCSTGFKSLTYIFSKGINFIMNYFCPESNVHTIFPLFGTNEYPTDSEQSN